MPSLKKTLSWMDSTHEALLLTQPLPKKLYIRDSFAYRYDEKSLAQAALQKLARVTSGLRSAHILLEHGLLQEQAALCRMIDEFQDDVLFLSFGILDGNVSDRHQQYLDAFYSSSDDENLSPRSFLEGKHEVPRRKIRSYIANHKLFPHEPSGAVSASKMISNVFSGYVHGASLNIMEMYHPNPPRFLTNGMMGRRLQEEHRIDFHNFVYRGVIAFCFAARAIGDRAMSQRAYEFLVDWENS
jgi:hypothetical protein